MKKENLLWKKKKHVYEREWNGGGATFSIILSWKKKRKLFTNFCCIYWKIFCNNFFFAMADLQATIEFAVELYKFYNVDLFQRGWVFFFMGGVFYFACTYIMLYGYTNIIERQYVQCIQYFR